MAEEAREREYRVASRVNGGKKHEDCIVYGPDEVIPATHRNVFGPSTRQECERWAAENCESSGK